jgi:hypothetical protein
MAKYEQLTVGDLTVEGQMTGGEQSGLGKAGGNEWFVDYTRGSDGNSGKSMTNAFKSLEAGYQAAVANQHDIVNLIAGSSGLQLETSTSTFTWSKGYTHLIGISNGAGFANRARIFHSNATAAALFTLSATGCLFSNFYLSHGNGDASNLSAFNITGDRNVFSGVHIAGPQNATEAAANNYSLMIMTGQENVFKNSIFGTPTTELSGTTPTLFKMSTGCARPFFQNCRFIVAAADTDITFMEIDVCGSYCYIDGCLFHSIVNAATGSTPAQALDVAAIQGDVVITDSKFIGPGAIADNTAEVYVENEVNVDDKRNLMVLVSASAVT